MKEELQQDKTTKLLIFIPIFISWAMIAILTSGLIFGIIYFILVANDIDIAESKLMFIAIGSAIVGGITSYFINRERLKNSDNYKNRNMFII